MGLSFSMIKILASFIDEKTLITIDDDGVLSIDSKYDKITELIKSVHARALKSYGPSDGFFGRYMAMELVKHGAKILEVSDTEEDKSEENRVW
jgi:hypothetical protein